MEIKWLFVLAPLLLNRVEGVDFQCATPAQFEEKYKDQIPQIYAEAKKANKQLHKFVYEKGKTLSSSLNLELKEITEFEPKIFIKKITFNSYFSESIVREIEVMRKLCRHPTNDFSELLQCNSEIIPSFYGCVVEDPELYVFHDKMDLILGSDSVRMAYSKMAPIKKIEVVFDVIDKFIELHREGIVNGDIRLENIAVKDLSFSGFRMFNIRYANYEGKDYVEKLSTFSGHKLFQMPNLKGTKVTFQQDIYSLGVSLAYLQRYFGKAMTQVEKFDFKKPTYKEDWDAIIESAVKSVLSVSK